jgi:hypothetical protein
MRLAVILALMLLFAVPAFGATASDGLSGRASANYTVRQTPPPTEDPRCERLRLKLQKQKRSLPLAKTKQKRAFIRRNMGITRRRLANDGCTA